jgi:Tfp pilus assembly protein PilZ
MATPGPKRRYHRIKLPRGPSVTWRGTGERLVSRVETIGLGGLFIVTPKPPPAGEAIQLYFEVPGGEVCALAVVRSSTQDEGMGVEFTAMNAENRARLEKLVSRLLGEPPVNAPSAIPARYSSKRRSTRVAASVTLKVRGIDGNGQPFLEETTTLEVGLQGCKYFSRYALPTDSWLSVEVLHERGNSNSPHFAARVTWLRKSRKESGLFHVGVEFEEPGNVWRLANPPEDWRQPDIPA